MASETAQVAMAASAEGATNGAVSPIVVAAFKPQLMVPSDKAEDALKFYKEAFGAEEVNRVNHPKRKAEQEVPLLLCAELKIGGSGLLICDLNADSPATAAAEICGSNTNVGVAFLLQVEDVAAAVSNAVKAGGVLEGEIATDEGPCCGGLVGKVRDPFGHMWSFVSGATPTKDCAAAEPSEEPISPTFSSSSSSSSSVYGVLESYGFPMGLFPEDAVETFSVDPNGTFQVLLRKPCITKFEIEVKYGTSVTGRIGYGQISDLKGVLAQELFLWFPVKGVKVDIPTSGIIYFDIGVIFKRLSLWLFDTPPECRGVVEEDRSGWRWSEDGVFFDADDIIHSFIYIYEWLRISLIVFNCVLFIYGKVVQFWEDC